MNPLDIYKKLPRTNCGNCPALTCLSFAVRLSKKEIALSECPELEQTSRQEINGLLSVVSDWKEKRLAELFNEIAWSDLSQAAVDIGARHDKDGLRLSYMGKKIRVSLSGFSGELDIWDKLLVLMYIKNAGSSRLSGKWTAFRDMKNGLIRSNSFNESCEKVLAGIYEKQAEGLEERLEAMGAITAGGQTADLSYIFHPLPKIPFLVLFWNGDQDFGPDCKILMDTTATDFLDVEALLYLGMALVRALS